MNVDEILKLYVAKRRKISWRYKGMCLNFIKMKNLIKCVNRWIYYEVN